MCAKINNGRFAWIKQQSNIPKPILQCFNTTSDVARISLKGARARYWDFESDVQVTALVSVSVSILLLLILLILGFICICHLLSFVFCVFCVR